MDQRDEVHLRSPEELSPQEQADLERALDSGVTELPPNHPKGLLGEKGPDLRKVEDFAPDLNAGLLQENDPGVIWLWIVLAYLLFFPLAYVVLWRSKTIPPKTKRIASAVGAAVIALLAIWLLVA